MKSILTVAVMGLAVVIGLATLFYLYVGAGHHLSRVGEDWNQFGGFFGGVAGTLLSFLSVVLLVYSIHVQSSQLDIAQHDAFKRELMSYVTKADDEIEHWLKRELSTREGRRTVEFGDVVWGVVQQTETFEAEVQPAVRRLSRLVFLYCESLALYRDNIDPYFLHRYHHQKATDLLRYVQNNERFVPVNERPAIKFAQMHLEKHEA